MTLLLASSDTGRLFLDLLLILATSALVATLFRRFRLEAIPGYLVAGALIGPHALGLVRESENVEQISGLAIILLMFTIGLMLELAGAKRGMLPILLVGALSTVACVLLFWPVVILFDVPAPAALVIAMALSMSSTAVLLRVLQGRRELRQMHARIAVGVSIVQDMASVLLLAMLPPIAVWAGAKGNVLEAAGPADGLADHWRLLSRGALAFGGIVAMLAAGRVFLPRIMNYVARTEAAAGSASGELILVLAAAVGLAAALFTAFLGLSPEMGAFLAGLTLSLTPFRHQLAGQLSSLRDLLMAIFFTTVGLEIDPAVIGHEWVKILVGLLTVLALKSLIIGGTAWALGSPAAVAVLTGLYLCPAGEFSLVILASGDQAGIFPQGGTGPVIAIVVLSLVIMPLLVTPGHRLSTWAMKLPQASWIRRSALREVPPHADEPSRAAPGASGPVVIAGFGPVGRNLADRLYAMRVPIVIIELNPSTVRRQAGLGRTVLYGDATNPEVLESAGIRSADALLLTIPDEDAMLRACQVARKMNPELFIAVRTNFLSQAIRARQLGADHVTVEEMATAEAMETQVLEQLSKRQANRALRAEPTEDSEQAPPATAQV